MIGAASLTNVSYTAFDPSTKTYKGLCQLGQWLSVLSPSFEYNITCLPFEDSVLSDTFDIAFTSPPYYNAEHYSDEITNSLNRYDTFDKWVDGFYTTLILKTVDCLSEKGVFILNIGDRKYPLSERLFNICKDNNLYCERIKDYLSGSGETKEKFYCISKHKKFSSKQKLF